MAVGGYQDMRVWQSAMTLAEKIYAFTSEFPKHELFGLVSQMQRCAVSVPSNIAEGHAKDATREYLKHVSIAMGSLAELETQLLLARQAQIHKQRESRRISERFGWDREDVAWTSEDG